MTKIASKSVEKEETKQKDKYKVTNWPSYNKALVGRGDITIWIDEEVLIPRITMVRINEVPNMYIRTNE
ncbi:MAG: hypothetical protein ACI8P3_003897 [Saprospiraceae bacterium]|jgi:hypothetical protein